MSFRDPHNNTHHLLRMAALLAAQSHPSKVDDETLDRFLTSSIGVKLAEAFLADVESQLGEHLACRDHSVAASVVGDAKLEAELLSESGAGDPSLATTFSTSSDHVAASDSEISEPAAFREASLPPVVPKIDPAMKIQLPNAKEGQAYSATISPVPEMETIIVGLQASEDFGVRLAPESNTIHGIPSKSGDFELAMQFRLVEDPEEILHSARAMLTVTPDPRKLWQNIASDPDVPFWKPDQDAALMRDERIIAASERGRSHAHKGSCRDDDFFINTSNDWRIAIVADGAGSAQYSRRGSQLAAQSAGNFIVQALSDDSALLAAADAVHAAATDEERSDSLQQLKVAMYKVVGHAAHEALRALNELSSTGGPNGLPVALADLNTTLLIAVCKEHVGGYIVGSYSIGDGAIGILSDGEVKLGGQPDGGEFSGGTRFLGPAYVQQDELWQRTRCILVEKFQSIVLMSDGVSDAKFKNDSALEDYAAWTSLLEEIRSEAGFPDSEGELATGMLDWLGFWVPGEHDDRTIAIIW